ncbi:MAG: LysM peptidoglycan-binding domain-containing protein [Clostridia bacterium]|nr:LysM peptidoglycan-binding domain-containing protein [Clostridia bacterium]
MITKVTADESSPYTADGVLAGCCLKVCYASAGESVWELARREHTSPEAIKAENELTADVLECDTVLLLPLR